MVQFVTQPTSFHSAAVGCDGNNSCHSVTKPSVPSFGASFWLQTELGEINLGLLAVNFHDDIVWERNKETNGNSQR